MASTLVKHVTIEEYERLPDPADGTSLELVQGEIVAMVRPNWEHGEIQNVIGALIWFFLRSHPIGRVAVESGVVTEQNPDTVRGPDVSYFSKERLPLGVRVASFVRKTPDLCVEVISPSNTRRQINEKLEEYFATGCRMAWIVDPEERSVTIYREPMEGRVIKEGATLDGGDVLPGFSCKVAEIFEASK